MKQYRTFPLTIFFYISKQFLKNYLIILLVFSVLIFIIDMLEIFRRVGDKDIGFKKVFLLTFFKYPIAAQKLFPFISLIASTLTYVKLSSTREISIMRAAGLSAFQFLLPSIISAFLVGVLVTCLVNPIYCMMIDNYEQMENKYIKSKASVSKLQDSELWLRQRSKPRFSEDNNEIETIITARKVNADLNKEDLINKEDKLHLSDVTIFVRTHDDKFIKRVDAKTGVLTTGKDPNGKIEHYWRLKNGITTKKGDISNEFIEYFLKTDLKKEDIQQSFASPETISFWQLPLFIETLKKAGFPAISHELEYQKLLANPFLYAVMVIISSLFTLKYNRMAKTSISLFFTFLTGFIIYFIINFVSSYGLSGRVSVELANWAPIAALWLGALGILIHLEDG